MVEWRAWYTSEREFASDDCEWRALPDDGVLAISLTWDGGSQAIYGFDHYFHVPGTDLYAGNDDPPAMIRERYPGAIIKRGQWTTPQRWREIKREAQRHGIYRDD